LKKFLIPLLAANDLKHTCHYRFCQ
jgi:hypothetical protein